MPFSNNPADAELWGLRGEGRPCELWRFRADGGRYRVCAGAPAAVDAAAATSTTVAAASAVPCAWERWAS